MSKQIKVIGGNRLGSGDKMKTAINNYNRSTHNLKTKIATSMSPGVLYPICVQPAMRGDAFDIDLAADCRTIPTKGALFGSYKLQVDVFQCPIRLYQAILHNNPTAIGLKMNQILLPTITFRDHGDDNGDIDKRKNGSILGEFSNNCLMKYLGISGIGTPENAPHIQRTVNAVPMLAYYDIYKTYYANKQEEEGVIIGTEITENQASAITYIYYVQETEHHSHTGTATMNEGESTDINVYPVATYSRRMQLDIHGENLNGSIIMSFNGTEYTLDEYAQGNALDEVSYLSYEEITTGAGEKILSVTIIFGDDIEGNEVITLKDASGTVVETAKLIQFPLEHIDEMRYELLSTHQLGTAYSVNDFDDLPYNQVADQALSTYHETWNQFPLQGLAIKTYQNDIYNNWLNTDWLEGENSISEMTNVSVTDGKFSMDALNFAQKLYNMLNRIVLAGNTYEDWQDVVYEEVKRRQIESPIFCGGMSREIMFDEVLQTTPTDDQPLGTIGGRGRFATDRNGNLIGKGGKIHVKCDEACFIIVIASLTPRIFYTQGNEFWATDLKSLDDLHKPALDGIGYQDLICERMYWKDTKLRVNAQGKEIITRNKIGKLPAWIEYMTNVDRAYGDMAADGGRGYMILNRNYNGEDYTTYVDPAKYNYAFADSSLTSQNFWLLFNIEIKARRLMSARIIPNV